MKGILFDFNGTLFDDTFLHITAWRKFFHDRFSLAFTVDEAHRRFIGPNNDAIFHDVFDGKLSREEVVKFSREKEAEYRAAARADAENFHLIEGAPEMFDMLIERHIPFALATASPIENVRFYLDELGLNKWFTMDRIVYEEGKLASKPDPAFYIEAARRLGLSSSECMIVEDSRTGIQAAINAHADRIIAIDRSTPREWLESQPEITAIIHDFRNFERFI